MTCHNFCGGLLEQQARWQVLQAERDSSILATEQEIKQLEWQLKQTATQKAKTRKLLITAQNKLATAKNNLTTDEDILKDLTPLLAEGAISHLQYRRQQQEAGKGQIEAETQQAEVNSLLSEIESLNQEQGIWRYSR